MRETLSWEELLRLEAERDEWRKQVIGLQNRLAERDAELQEARRLLEKWMKTAEWYSLPPDVAGETLAFLGVEMLSRAEIEERLAHIGQRREGWERVVGERHALDSWGK